MLVFKKIFNFLAVLVSVRGTILKALRNELTMVEGYIRAYGVSEKNSKFHRNKADSYRKKAAKLRTAINIIKKAK